MLASELGPEADGLCSEEGKASGSEFAFFRAARALSSDCLKVRLPSRGEGDARLAVGGPDRLPLTVPQWVAGSLAISIDPFLEEGMVDLPESSDQSFLDRDSCRTRGSPHKASCSHPSSPSGGLLGDDGSAGGGWALPSLSPSPSPSSATVRAMDVGGLPASMSVMAACRLSAVMPSFRLDSDSGLSKESSEMFDKEPLFLSSARGSSEPSAKDMGRFARRPSSNSSLRRSSALLDGETDMCLGVVDVDVGGARLALALGDSLRPCAGAPAGSTSMQLGCLVKGDEAVLVWTSTHALRRLRPLPPPPSPTSSVRDLASLLLRMGSFCLNLPSSNGIPTLL